MEASADKLFVFLHPGCTCSEASLDELKKIFVNLSEFPETHFIFSVPSAMNFDLENTRLWKQAHDLGFGVFHVDVDSKLSRTLNLNTSGIVLYFINEKLSYWCITAARSHRGDNLGASSLLKIIQDKNTDLAIFPSFGCALY